MGHFAYLLQVKDDDVKMNDFGFGTSRCLYCGDMHYRSEMVKDKKSGWYKEICKEKFFNMVNNHLNGGVKYAKKEAF